MSRDPALAEIARRLGVATDAEPATVLAALDEVLAEQVRPADAPQGTVVVDAAAHAQLVADAHHGRTVRDREQAATVDAAVDRAVMDGRITPHRAHAWRASLARDPGGLVDLNALPTGMVPLVEKGHAGDGVRDDEASGEWFRSAPAAPTRSSR